MQRLKRLLPTLRAHVLTQVSLIRNVLWFLRSPRDGSLGTLTALVIANGLTPVMLIFVTRGLVDHLVAARNSGAQWAAVLPLLMWASAGAALMLLVHALTAAVEWKRTLYEERLKEYITERIHQQSVRLDLSFYESPEFFDRLHRAREEAGYRPAELCRAYVEVLQGVIVLAGLASALFAFGPWLPVVLFLGALPVMFVVSTHALAYQRWRQDATPDERRNWYYEYVLTAAHHAPELRVLDIGGRFRSSHRVLRAKLRDEQLGLLWRRVVAEARATAGSALVIGVTVVWMGWRAVQGMVSFGQLAGFYQAFASGLSTMRSLLTGVARIHANAFFIEGLLEFFALEPRIASPKEPTAVPTSLRHGIRFRNVTFGYPHSARPALEKFNLYVPAGRTAAIVGPNGAGKTTLFKLICRLYDPAEGSIEIDGVDIRRFELGELRKLTAVLFQPPNPYYESAEANIRLGSLASTLTRSEVQEASAAAGASGFIEKLRRGYDTALGTLFDDGTELSTGEWQRIALARTLARRSPIVLLDEPTSSLDPWAEGDWYRRVRAAVPDTLMLIVTHRLSTAMRADHIYVMDHGSIVESGTHNELLAKGGRYAACVQRGDDSIAPMELART